MVSDLNRIINNMQASFPNTQRIRLGYSPEQDRIVLFAHLQQGEVRRAFITRRLLIILLNRMGNKLAESHYSTLDPYSELQMEHILAVNGARPEQEGKASEQILQMQDYLVTNFQIEIQESQLILGLIAEEGPVAGISLSRTQAHQLMRMLSDQANQAGWEVKQPVPWMQHSTD